MKPTKQSNIPAKVTVGSTAKNVVELVDVELPSDVDVVQIQPQGGAVRYTIGEYVTPNATTGFILEDGQTRIFVGTKPEDLKLYAGSNTTCAIAIGRI